MNLTDDFGNTPLAAHPEKAQEGINFFKNEVSVPQKLVEAIFGNSPYLSKLAKMEKEFLVKLCENGFDNSFKNLLAELESLDITKINKKDLMSYLRVRKNRASLLIALADITNNWGLKQVTNALSNFADLTVKLATDFLLYEKFQQKLLASARPEESGFIVLAVGKLGGHELNYSSDIDLIVLYDADHTNYTGKLTPKEFFIRLTQELVEILQQRTSEGYVFRTDLRLRPDPYSTPIAVSTKAAELYYENVGQNWERAAMIKARFIAGDEAAAKKYLHFLGTYIWRKYLDFKAVEDIHSIKRQIDSKADYKPEQLLGYNIKLGKGGIREIEFFVQTQQLIWGGREQALRCNTTCEGLAILEEIGHIQKGVAAELITAYEFYRKIEHRLQMVNDEHTHSLPTNEEALKNFAIFLGFNDLEKFKSELTASFALVQKHYAHLFEESRSLGSGSGNLVFTGVSNDPETMLTIAKMGFRNAEKICEIIRGWHHGRRRATRFRRVREILTELVPHILKSFADSSNPDEAFIKFDDFLGQIPSGVQLFSLFEEKPELIDLLAEIMGNSPWLAQNLSRSPALVNRILLADFSSKFPRIWDLRESLQKAIGFGTNFDEKMKIIRRWKHDKEFQVGIRLLKNIATHEYSAFNLSDIAEVVIEEVFKLVQEYEDEKPSGQVAILAMGKLGVRELTFGSDLDLVFVYNSTAPEAAGYYTRMVSKFTAQMELLSSDGNLYNIDTRLRPMGEKGPLAASVEAYEKYYTESAWNWEFMALTKVRVIYGEADLRHRLEGIIAHNLTRKINNETLAADMGKMRQKISGSYDTKNIWDVKYAEGGIFEIEFIFQYYILAEGHNHPDIISTNFENKNIAKTLHQKGIIGARQAEDLSNAFTLLRNVQSAIRLTSQSGFEEKNASENQKRMMTNSLGEVKFENLKNKLVQTEKLVHEYYEQVFKTK